MRLKPPLAALISALIAFVGCGRTTPIDYVPLPIDAGHDAGIDGGIDAGSDAGIDAGTDAGTPCIPGNVTLTRAQPTLMFVIDRSGSMAFSFGASTRWAELRKGLVIALPPVDQSMALGAYIFPAAGSSASCSAPLGIDIPPAVGNANPINSLLARSTPLGGTPTADALIVAANALRNVRAAKSSRGLVLATDGAPGCNQQLDPFTCVCTRTPGCGANGSGDCLDDTRTVSRMAAIADGGIPTWVIGIQDGTDALLTDVLNRMAVAGGRPHPGTPQYYPATNPNELDSALISIRDQIGQCTFLTGSVPDAQGMIRVFVDGQYVAEDPANGWTWADRANGELEFVGGACARLARTAQVTANVGCFEPNP